MMATPRGLGDRTRRAEDERQVSFVRDQEPQPLKNGRPLAMVHVVAEMGAPLLSRHRAAKACTRVGCAGSTYDGSTLRLERWLVPGRCALSGSLGPGCWSHRWLCT